MHSEREKLPPEAIELYNQYIHGEIDRRAFLSGAKRFAVAGTRTVVSRSPEEFRAFVKSETENYAAVIKSAGITVD